MSLTSSVGASFIEDTTVYAIYDKNVSPMNEAPTLEVKDNTIKKGEKFNLMSLVVSAKDKEDGKGKRCMPWHKKPMKDVISCDKPR